MNILADVLSSVAGSVIPPGAEPSRNVLMAGITFGGALPIAILVRSPQVLAQLLSRLGRDLNTDTPAETASTSTELSPL